MAKPWKVKGVGAKDPFRDAARVIVATKYAELQSYLPAVLDAPSEELIHDMRIAAKRLREALKLVRDGLSRDEARVALAAADGMNEALGRVRDRDVLLLWLENVAQADLSENERQALAVLHSEVAAEREVQLAELGPTLQHYLGSVLPVAMADLVGRKRIEEVFRRHG